MPSNERIVVSKELGRKRSVLIFKMLPHLPLKTYENHDYPKSGYRPSELESCPGCRERFGIY